MIYHSNIRIYCLEVTERDSDLKGFHFCLDAASTKRFLEALKSKAPFAISCITSKEIPVRHHDSDHYESFFNKYIQYKDLNIDFIDLEGVFPEVIRKGKVLNLTIPFNLIEMFEVSLKETINTAYIGENHLVIETNINNKLEKETVYFWPIREKDIVYL